MLWNDGETVVARYEVHLMEFNCVARVYDSVSKGPVVCAIAMSCS